MLSLDRQAAWSDAIRQIKRAVPVPEVLHAVGARRRGGSRYDCLFCTGHGHQRGTLSVIKDQGWRCHRCGEHGDVITLVMKLRRCDFVTALKYLGELGRLSMPTAMTPAERRHMQKQEQLFKRAHSAADRLEAEQHTLRLHYRAEIHISERLMTHISTRLAGLMNANGDEVSINSYWAWLVLLWDTLQEALAAYSLLAFGSARDRAEFVLKRDKRESLIADIRMAGGFNADVFPGDPPHFVEVLS